MLYVFVYARVCVVVVPRVRRVYTGREVHVGRYLTAIDERGSGGGGGKIGKESRLSPVINGGESRVGGPCVCVCV